MKIAVVGSREFGNKAMVCAVLGECVFNVDTIVSGGARGVDSWGAAWAKEHCDLPPIIFKAEWDKYPKVAGFLRNTTIVENCDIVLAFWDGQSTGTVDTITKAIEKGIPVKVWMPDGTRHLR
jgi:hypothetical protein